MADIAQQMPGGSPGAAIDEAKRQKLLELVRGRNPEFLVRFDKDRFAGRVAEAKVERDFAGMR